MPSTATVPTSHARIRLALRIAGPAILLVGLVLTSIGLVDFFQSFASFGEPGGGAQPKRFWMAFVGLPLTGVGGMISLFGFMGAIAKYQVRETTPAAAEAINRVGRDATPGIRDIAGAIASGLSKPQARQRKRDIRDGS